MKKLTLLLGLILLASCQPKKSSVRSGVANNNNNNSGVSLLTQCNGQASNIGTIYDSSATSFQFNDRVKALLSADINPNDVGFISSMESDSTGVRFSGAVKIDGSGNIIAAQSKVVVTVYDSKVTQEGASPITLTFDPADTSRNVSISGRFVTDGESTMTLQDSLGSITFKGRLDAQRFSGNAEFANNANVLGGQNYAGPLGQFYILRCSFLK
jgi:hypothetical protein